MPSGECQCVWQFFQGYGQLLYEWSWTCPRGMQATIFSSETNILRTNYLGNYHILISRIIVR